jgi:hypothetical protein
MAKIHTFTANDATGQSFSWDGGEGVLLTSGTFDGGKVSLKQDINGEFVTFANGTKAGSGGFKFVTTAPNLKITFTGSTSASANVYVSVQQVKPH